MHRSGELFTPHLIVEMQQQINSLTVQFKENQDVVKCAYQAMDERKAKAEATARKHNEEEEQLEAQLAECKASAEQRIASQKQQLEAQLAEVKN